ncbi:MAG: hypothetical protein RL199_764 [Pseudomonadota bacterium]|jgi:murein DD-endopeptidase MepM/ murein hydrolase activator NlpD
MSILDTGVQRPKNLHEAAQALESVLLQTVLKSSGAFHGTEGIAGSDMRADLFVGALADAVAKSGGMGLAAQLERSLGAGPATGGAGQTGGGVLPSPVPAASERLLPTYRLPALNISGSARPPPEDAGANERPSSRGDQADEDWVRPVEGRVSSPFGIRPDPLHGRRAAHHGVDLSAPAGSPISAAAGGVVVRAGERGGYGLAVEIEHDDGSTTLYAHASRLLVSGGDQVNRGQPIALVGRTGRATGDHLHFELRRDGRPVDPSSALKVYRARVESSE